MAEEVARALARALQDEADVVVAYHFGSTAAGTADAISDVDVALHTKPAASHRRRLRLTTRSAATMSTSCSSTRQPPR